MIIEVFTFIWDMIKVWLSTLFITPFSTTSMLWLLIPLWTAWFFAEFFQEKEGTSIGNAMSNAVIILWASIDSTRQTIHLITTHAIVNVWDMVGRFVLLFILLSYGLVIVILGWRGNTIIKKIARVRIVTYLFAMFVPIFYGAIPFSWEHLLATIVFFPVFYFAIEWIDQHLPDPEAVVEDEEAQSTTPWGKKV